MGTQPVAQDVITARWTERLKGQAADVQRITSGFDEAALARRPIPDKWSLKELVCHLWRVQQVFGGRVVAMLDEENPPLATYDQEDDPQFIRMLESPASELLAGFLKEREALVERLATLKAGDWKRAGRHPEYKRYDVEFCVEYLAYHEAHHLYQMLQRRDLL